MNLIDELKDEFYSIQTHLWLKVSNKEVVVWWYKLELSTKPLLEHLKSMKEY